MCKNIHDKDDHNWDIVGALTEKVFAARDDFFEFVSTFDGWAAEAGYVSCLEEDEATNDRPLYDSLWDYFGDWTAKVAEDMQAAPWLDPRAHDAMREQFLRLTPTIYLLVCETYDLDPSKLDLIKHDPVTGEETRIERRVKSKLPDQELGGLDVISQLDMSTAEGLQRAAVMHLLTGAVEAWPKPIFGPAVPDGETKYL
ncbi:hypothetical protein [Nocardia sp. alder85J]|uniref:hypothetical protein n=1 Tax=Nocardia sp. alder85J TaxID=2862949 RepID=UPI001CD377FA|nr:hypothetical protein [Nocardia sp. alder85J]MCX4098048.1 hypothetical protein [Nocardia sp. alder85J]